MCLHGCVGAHHRAHSEVRGQPAGIAPILLLHVAGNQIQITKLGTSSFICWAVVSSRLKRRIPGTKGAVWHPWLMISTFPSLHLQEIAASYTDGVLDSTECGRIYALCFNSYQSVSNVFMEKCGSHLAIKLFLKSCGKLPGFFCKLAKKHSCM